MATAAKAKAKATTPKKRQSHLANAHVKDTMVFLNLGRASVLRASV